MGLIGGLLGFVLVVLGWWLFVMIVCCWLTIVLVDCF